ncbi:MAG TPA: DAK2 domain-containing protein [Acidimicrobiales bacterium]|nr:DAK2 domain-containing protein [Acidimicrobiales bacterium]
MTAAALGAPDVAGLMTVFGQALERHRDTLNRLNVYPVPDGDTGTNMHLTLESVTRELSELADYEDLAAVCTAISHGSLMGARGNSGVILCQILRGMAQAFSAAEVIDARTLATGLAGANAAARSGVMRPVEGTILTVAAAAAEAAGRAACSSGCDLAAVAAAARSAAVEALARTPEQLPTLAKAGVVDAGGAGLVLLFDALVQVTSGEEMPGALALPEAVAERLSRNGAVMPEASDELAELQGLAHEGGDPGGDLRYEVMYFLEAPDELVPAFKQVWAGIGDSIVVVGGDGLWNCHIHTNDIGGAIEAALDAGRPRSIRVTDLLEQVEEESWVRRAEEQLAHEPEPEEAGPPQHTAVIAVATGDGIRRIFHSLGVRHIVAGGQSMNPSTAEILEMIDEVPAAEVVILPNNKNIFAVARQAAEVASKPARVVPTEGIQEGFAALMEYDPEATAEDNAAAMATAMSRVVAGEVTQAVRSGDTPAGEVAEGDWIGLTRNGVEVIGTSAAEAACLLLDRIVTPAHEIVTIIEGAGARPADTRRITEWLAEHRPGASVDLHDGGQPLYRYLVSAE